MNGSVQRNLWVALPLTIEVAHYGPNEANRGGRYKTAFAAPGHAFRGSDFFRPNSKLSVEISNGINTQQIHPCQQFEWK